MARCAGGIMAITHGGQLHTACMQYGGQPQNWLDLSTGIAPWSYPLPSVPERVWQRLPENDDGLVMTASHYYQVEPTQVLPIAGSQWAIEQIPRLYPAGLRVAMLINGYAEHPHAWRMAGHEVITFDSLTTLCAEAKNHDAVVIIQPHNPLGVLATDTQLIQLKADLRQGIMVLDEAFADTQSVPSLALDKDIWRLRSIGKFFGLAGIRLGFVCAMPAQIQQLTAYQSPWAVNHLARWAGQLALADTAWQTQQKQKLTEQSERLHRLLSRHVLNIIAYSDYFVTVCHVNAKVIVASAASHHILLRHFPAFDGIRFGLPKTEGDWFKLERWLSEMVCQH